MYNPNIECRLFCPQCGFKWTFNDEDYMKTLRDTGLSLQCPKCHRKVYATPNNTETIVKESHVVRVTEGELRNMIKQSIKECLSPYILEEKKDNSINGYCNKKKNLTFYTNNGKTKLQSVVSIYTNNGQYCHIVEDDHCYILYNGFSKNDKDCKRIEYIFPDAFNALRELPPL